MGETKLGYKRKALVKSVRHKSESQTGDKRKSNPFETYKKMLDKGLRLMESGVKITAHFIPLFSEYFHPFTIQLIIFKYNYNVN